MTSKDFTFYTNTEYWRELPLQFAKAKKGDRIAMIVMSFDTIEPTVATVIASLKEAASRGVEAHLIVDAYNFLVDLDNDTPGPLLLRGDLKYVWGRYRRISQTLQTLENETTIHVSVINMPDRPFTNPKGGRSHIKFTIINDQVFVGGCNLFHTKWLDCMVAWRDKRVADYLYNFILELHVTKSTKALMKGVDRQLEIDPQTTLYIDAGKKRQSIIFKKALQFIDEAEESVVITCQYFPNSITAKHLVAAHRRGVDVRIVHPAPSKQGFIGGTGQLVSNARERLRVPKELFGHRLPKNGLGIHAKIIATEKGALIGSHNYVNAGVLFGTAEIALLRHDPEFAKATASFVDRLLTQ